MMIPGDLLRDLQYALKTMAKAPTLTLIALLSFAIGIAANTTIFSVIYTVLLAPPLYKNADRLVVAWESSPVHGAAKTPVAPATFRDWRENNHVFEELELIAAGSPVTVTGSELPERASIQYATPDLFKLLGVPPTLGRAFIVQEFRSADPVILSYGFWQRHFGGATDVLGQHMIVNGSVHTIVGVLPKDFHLFSPDTDLWEPILLPGPETQGRSFRSNPGPTTGLSTETLLRDLRHALRCPGRVGKDRKADIGAEPYRFQQSGSGREDPHRGPTTSSGTPSARAIRSFAANNCSFCQA